MSIDMHVFSLKCCSCSVKLTGGNVYICVFNWEVLCSVVCMSHLGLVARRQCP